MDFLHKSANQLRGPSTETQIPLGCSLSVMNDPCFQGAYTVVTPFGRSRTFIQDFPFTKRKEKKKGAASLLSKTISLEAGGLWQSQELQASWTSPPGSLPHRCTIALNRKSLQAAWTWILVWWLLNGAPRKWGLWKHALIATGEQDL